MPASLLGNSEQSQQVPVQLIQILTKINDNIAEVKERVIRLEAQDYQHTARDLRESLEKEIEKRRTLEDKVNALTNRLAPILAGGTMLVTLVINWVLRTQVHL